MGKNSAAREARRARADEEARQARIKEGTARVREQFAGQFNPGYYARLGDALNQRYDKDLQQQYHDATQELQAALMRAGLFDSSVGAERTGLASEKYQQALAQVEGAKTDTIQRRKQDVAQAENSVISQLTATADQNAAFANAESQIKANYEQPQFPVLGQLFTDFTAGLAGQAEAERQGNNRYNLGVSQWGNRARNYVKNIG